MEEGRRTFLKSMAAGLAGAGMMAASPAMAAEAGQLLVWSCGGLAEAMVPAHAAYQNKTGVKVSYTGAFAAALGKSLLGGSGETDVFAGRVLQLAKNLRKGGKMAYFKPLCFTSYGIVVPKGNPKGITKLEDLAVKGMRVAMAPLASPPGGDAAMGILKLSKLTDKVMPNVLDKRATCIQRTVQEVIDGNADAMIVEKRITCIPRFTPHLDFIEIPEAFMPPGPLTFTVGVMNSAKDKDMAAAYVDWITSPEGQDFYVKAGFISAYSEKGLELTKKLGVYDV